MTQHRNPRPLAPTHRSECEQFQVTLCRHGAFRESSKSLAAQQLSLIRSSNSLSSVRKRATTLARTACCSRNPSEPKPRSVKKTLLASPIWSRSVANNASSLPGGSGFRIHSQASFSFSGLLLSFYAKEAPFPSRPNVRIIRGRVRCSAPPFRMRSKLPEVSRTSVWIGVAVPSKRCFARGPMRSMKSSRLFGSSFFSPSPPRRRALCASSSTTVPNLRSSRCWRSLKSSHDQPSGDDRDATRNGQRAISSGPRVLIM